MRIGLIWITVPLWLAAASPSIAQEGKPAADEQAIRENARLYADAFNRGDAKALAALWAPEAVYVDSDTRQEFKGRAEIEAKLTSLFADGAKPQIAVSVLSVRLVTPNVAIEDGIATVLAPDGSASDTSYTAVSVKQDGKWLLDNVRETTLPPPPTASDHLRQLDWLVGEWIDGDSEDFVHSTIRWSANGAFLTQTFSVVAGGGIDMQGTQIIGWDPTNQRIRSWVFDSDGGFGEGTWEQDGDRWVVRSKSTLPDGRTGDAINVYRRLDDDTLTWKSTARHVEGEMLPNVDEVAMARVVPQADIQAAPSAGKE